METFQSRFYGAGTNLGAIFQHPGRLSQQAHDNLQKDLTEKYAGLAKSQKAIILEEGMTFKKVGMPLNDAQFLESRTFQVVEIARWFNLPPHKLKELSKATFSNIEQQQIEFVQDTIRPWLVRWEQHTSWKLLDEGERRRLFAEFMIDALLRGDIETRNAALSTQRMNGAINANEWRAMLNMNPIPGRAGTLYWQPLNMTDAGEPDTIAASEGPPAPDDDEEEENSLSPKEQRQRRTVQSRRRVAQAYKSVFMNAVQRILAKETKAIRRLAKKNFSERQLGEFVFDINQYYKTFRNTISKEIGGVYSQYGEAIYPMAADEINADVEPTAEYMAYVAEFTETTTKRYVSSSVAQLTKMAQEEDPLAAIEERLEHWEETRAEQIAGREIVDGEAGFAQFVYYSFGFSTVWVTFGKNCPYCDSLDGMVISRGMNFLSAGQAFQPEGADSPLVVSGNVSHPGAHGGCDCSVMASL